MRTTVQREHPATLIRVLVFVFMVVSVIATAEAYEPAGAQVEEEPVATPFQTATVDDGVNQYITFSQEPPEDDGPPGGGRPSIEPIPGAMTAEYSNIVVIPGGGVIGGDVLEFDVTLTNTSAAGSGVVLTAFAFQSKFSESPALGSRIGDKLFYATAVADAHPDGPMGTVKKNGTSNGLFTGKWKGICINSSTDFIPEFNSGLEDESLECAGSRADTNGDGEPELLTSLVGLHPGQSQTVRLRLDSGTTDGALHVVEPGTLTGTVKGEPVVGPNGVTYYDVQIDTPGTVTEVVEFGDNKVLRDADGTFNPTFAPLADGLSFLGQQYLTLPRRSFAFSDIIGRNHSCATYGLTIGACTGPDPGSPLLNLLDTGDLVAGVQNFAAILRGYGEFHDADGDLQPDTNPLTGNDKPSFPYGVECENCGGVPYVPVAEFYVNNPDGSVTRQMTAGSYGDPVAAPYSVVVDSATAADFLQEIIPEPDPGGPPPGPQLGTSADADFRDLLVLPGSGINGGDAVEFTIDITNTSTNPDAYLTALNYQTKRRGLADIGVLDGYTQDRRDVRVDSVGLPVCASPIQFGACFHNSIGAGNFPNTIGNGLLFGQMVWTDANAGREPLAVDSDQVAVNERGLNPTPFWLESVKKNGPFSPILKGNENFICVKSGLFDLDPDSDAACAGQPAILINPDLNPVPGNISQRLGLPPGQTQSVRIRMEWGDFRGAMLKIVAGTLNSTTVRSDYASTSGLARFFDCSDQRELEYCHPNLVGTNIGYLPATTATWQTPATLEEIEYVIINQPGDAPTVMNFQENFGYIMAMAGFRPGAEFYAPDTNPELNGTEFDDILIRQQVLGTYGVMPPQSTVTTTGGGGGVGGTDVLGTTITQFLDVPESSIFAEDILWLVSEKITLGCTADGSRFCPTDEVTRGQMAAFISRALKLPPGVKAFDDTTQHQFAGVISSLADAGITTGCNAAGTEFCPDDEVTRGQMAAFIARALGLSPGTQTFGDTVGHMFQGEIAALAENGITTGCKDGTVFCPEDPVTREQMAAFLQRALNNEESS